ncbi:ferredoxin [Mycobacterium sp. CVI_P3]|uniref:Ferredoxin n=1 Tax=Mycobacterium pinniadriaticum TaxID=2994102 RepID=A0ABT3S711_9MYCO|nr:ferredoxin [Mycobacterium pinniadriaticum]MCX2928838.1 ferredoxin [Mycobacterium pinniadriaticum]MCX2935295.1 ferredoxin [Mycobacterium pinniadriaticum]
MKASVDSDRCAGHGDCVSICPAVFGWTADGFAEVILDEIPAQYHDLVGKAAQDCPEHAIEVDGG